MSTSRTLVAAPNLTPPPGNPRFPLFDALRAIAALCVFAGHTVTGTFTLSGHVRLFGLAVYVADQGVAIFFLISGFLLYRPFVAARSKGRPFSLAAYFRRRVLRIVPCYWVALTLFLVLGLVGGITASNWWIFYGFGQNYSFSTIGSGIGVAWTLCIEVTFYLALPLFALFAARLSPTASSVRGDVGLLSLLAAGALAYRAHFHAFSDLATVSTLPGFFFWFALGMGLAVASVTGRAASAVSRLHARLPQWPLLSWGLAAILFVLLREAPTADHVFSAVLIALVQHVLYGLTALFVLAPAVFEDRGGGVVRGLLRSPALAWVGLVSYAFYLYHPIVIAQIDKLVADHGVSPRYPIVLVASLAISLACAAASFYLLERPLMRLGRGGRRRRGSGQELARAEDPAAVQKEAAR